VSIYTAHQLRYSSAGWAFWSFLTRVSSSQDGHASLDAATVSVGHRRALTTLAGAAALGIHQDPAYSETYGVSQKDVMAKNITETSLMGAPLQPCTQAGDARVTGWTRTGTCAWEPSDEGFHQVCVTMSDAFLESSKVKDDNDLSPAVRAGGHWCICAWAWASAVRRDPKQFEGLSLDCTRTNGRLRDVYRSYIAAGEQLESPSGALYPAKEALDAVNALCGARKSL